MGEVPHNNSTTFFLNNFLLSVQFFENYDRDSELLRKNWFKDFSIESQNKKCFFADSLFKIVEKNVKFSPQCRVKEYMTFQLHPFRIYISNDNVKAAYDPSILISNEPDKAPNYKFTVRPADSEKSGCVKLVEFKRKEAPNKIKRPYSTPNVSECNHTVNSNEKTQENSYYFDEKLNKRFTKAEFSGGLHNRIMNTKMSIRRGSLRFFPSAEGPIPINGFYKFANSEATLKPQAIQNFRMNSALTTSNEIPIQSFQMDEIKRKVLRRGTVFNEYSRTQNILNSAAFMGYFCDLIMEKLSEPLHLDLNAVNESTVSGEFIIVSQKGTRFYIAPIIPIQDWNNYVVVSKKIRDTSKTEQAVWPTNYMWKIINLLPCNAVPTAHFEENLHPEKMWTLVFSKAEEFLLLHMMHAHVRCYLFALLIYKSFIEKEVNETSFGPKHLMHLLFWNVHKNFFAWPEDRPAETLLNYLKILYKKLQSKSLCDFFLNSRNLFAGSLTKDLHKAQTIIKKIIENPVFYISRAVRNLQLGSNFYPTFDILKLSTVLQPKRGELDDEKKKSSKGRRREKKDCGVQTVQKQRWNKNASTEMEGKYEEQERLSRLPKESTDIFEEMLDIKTSSLKKYNQVLEIFICHFLQMGVKSLEYNFLSQALLYLSQSEKLYELMSTNETNQEKLHVIKEKIDEVKKLCPSKLKRDFRKSLSRQFQGTFEKNPEDVQKEEDKKCKNAVKLADQVNQLRIATFPFDDEINEVVTVKL